MGEEGEKEVFWTILCSNLILRFGFDAGCFISTKRRVRLS